MRRFGALWIGLILGLLTAALPIVRPAFLEDLERELLDARFRVRGVSEPSGRVVVLAVDAASIDRVGRWPWPRETVAELVTALCDSGVAAIAFDIVFSEPQREPWRETAEALRSAPNMPAQARILLEQELAEPTGDEALGQAIAACQDRIVLGYFFRGVQEQPADPGTFAASPVSMVRIASDTLFDPPNAAEVEQNIPLLTEQSLHQGFFNTEPDGDGQIRHYQLIWKYGESLYPALAVEAVRIASGSPLLKLNVGESGSVDFRIGDLVVESDETGRQLVDFRGPGGTVPHVSAVDVLDGRAGSTLQGAIAFLGVTEVGLKDVRPTAMDRLFPGTEIHATAADGILRQQFLYRSSDQILLDIGFAFGLPFLLGFLMQAVRRPFRSLLLTLGLAAAWCIANQYAFSEFRFWLNATYPLLGLGATWSAITLFHLLTVEERARQIRDVFQKYVASSVVEEMLGDPSRVRLGGERKNLTILFSDIRGFTTISESMDPEELVNFLNAYFSPMTEIILSHKGTFDKYMGDALMAFWGAPLPMVDHATSACTAALAMRRALQKMKEAKEIPGIEHLDIGIGINTGPAAVGNMGSEQIYDYTVIGDAANLASRLEGANKSYGTRILISETTAQAASSAGFLCRRLDRVRVKGKDKPVEIFELLDDELREDSALQAALPKFAEGIELYFEGQFDEAATRFRHALEIDPVDQPSKVFLQRCESFLSSGAPTDWDGVYVMQSK